MKKIFVYPSHCDGKHVPGVDYARLILPMQELAKHPDFEVTIFDGKKRYSWNELAEEYDIFYLNYMTNADSFVQACFWFDKFKKKIVMDIDDLIWEIQEDNAAYSTYAPGSEGRAVVTDTIARGVDFVTVTNQYLKMALAHYTKKPLGKIKVFPNYIDLDLYKWRKEPKDDYEITIGYFGSSSHFNDLVNPGFKNGLVKIMKENPRVRLLTVGMMIHEIRKLFGPRYKTAFGDHDLYKWVGLMPDILKDVDLFVAPLVDTTYARCKSSIKFLEMSSIKLPGVFQDIRQYQEVVEHGKNGYLAATEHDWYKSLKELVNSVDQRKKIGEAAFRTIEKGWQMRDNVQRYVNFFNSIE